ncbi:MAG: hypothetical protein IJ829_02955, partial [Kiritimatiellae bacterium]|nr:hypothetical protein [Kiritimatiellia bacterium]
MTTRALHPFSLALLLCAALAPAAKGAFVDDIRALGAEVVSSDLPEAAECGSFAYALSLKNKGELALRGTFFVETVDANGK